MMIQIAGVWMCVCSVDVCVCRAKGDCSLSIRDVSRRIDVIHKGGYGLLDSFAIWYHIE